MLRDGLISGRAGEVTSLPTLGNGGVAKRLVVHGTGKPEAHTVDGFRTRAGNLARALRGLDARRVAVSTQATEAIDAEAAGRSLAEGFLLGLYRFDRHHTRAEDRPRGSVESVVFVEPSQRKLAALERGVEAGRILAEATNFTRDLANEPANLMTPTIVAERAQAVAAETGLECTIIERAEAERLGMGSYLSVANGSVQPPKFIVLRYRNGGRARPIGLVGKGITFDTGGISLKPGAGMERMKGDMTGAACVIGAMQAIARLGPAGERHRRSRRAPRTCRAARRPSPAMSSTRWTASRSRCSTPTPRVASCWRTALPTRGSRAARRSSMSRR